MTASLLNINSSDMITRSGWVEFNPNYLWYDERRCFCLSFICPVSSL